MFIARKKGINVVVRFQYSEIGWLENSIFQWQLNRTGFAYPTQYRRMNFQRPLLLYPFQKLYSFILYGEIRILLQFHLVLQSFQYKKTWKTRRFIDQNIINDLPIFSSSKARFVGGSVFLYVCMYVTLKEWSKANNFKQIYHTTPLPSPPLLSRPLPLLSYVSYVQPYLENFTETFYLYAASANSTDNSCYARFL